MPVETLSNRQLKIQIITPNLNQVNQDIQNNIKKYEQNWVDKIMKA